MRHIPIWMAVLMGLSGTALAQTPAAAPSLDPDVPPTIVRTGPSIDDRITVPISIDGKGPWNFIVDTGSQRTVLSRDLADHLALIPGADVTVLSMTGSAITNTVAVPRLGFGAATIDDIEAPVLEAQNLGAPGLLGLDGLHSRRLLLNFRTGRMEISKSRRTDSYSFGDTIVVEARRRRGQLILLDSQVNGMTVNIILDTGTNVSVGNLALMNKLIAKKRAPLLADASLTSVTGDLLTGKIGLIREVRMGRITMRDLGVLFADAAPFAALNLQDKPALLLGINALKVFDRVAIDFGTAKIDFLMPDMGAIERARFAAAAGASG